MAKSVNFELFFKNNQSILLIIGLVLVGIFVFGINVDFVGEIFISKGEQIPNDNTKKLGNGGGCKAIPEVN